MPLKIKPTPLAAQQIRSEALWWRLNRTRAPKLFRSEIRRAFELLTRYPEIGAVAEDVKLLGVRRLLLIRTQHYIYYRINEVAASIEVLAVWSTHRGGPPPMPAA